MKYILILSFLVSCSGMKPAPVATTEMTRAPTSLPSQSGVHLVVDEHYKDIAVFKDGKEVYSFPITIKTSSDVKNKDTCKLTHKSYTATQIHRQYQSQVDRSTLKNVIFYGPSLRRIRAESSQGSKSCADILLKDDHMEKVFKTIGSHKSVSIEIK